MRMSWPDVAAVKELMPNQMAAVYPMGMSIPREKAASG